MNELHEAARTGDLKKMEQIIAQNPGSLKEKHSETKLLPITCAVLNGQFEAFKLLLANNSPIPAPLNGKTSMHWAALGGSVEIAKHLRSLGLLYDAESNDGYTTMHGAAQGGRLEMMKFLNENGVPYNVKTKDGQTAMHIAAAFDRVTAMQFLNANGKLSYDIKTNDGKTPLMVATPRAKYFLETIFKTTSNPQPKGIPLKLIPALPSTPRIVPVKPKSPVKITSVPPFNTPIATPQGIFPSRVPIPSTTGVRLQPTPVAPQKPTQVLLQDSRIDFLKQLQQQTEKYLRKQIAELEKQVAMYEADNQKQQKIITHQQQEIEKLRGELAQQQTSTAPRASNPQRPWAPNFHPPISSTSPSAPESSDVEITGANENGENLQALSFVAVKTEPTEMNKDSYSGKKHSLEKGAGLSQAKRHK